MKRVKEKEKENSHMGTQLQQGLTSNLVDQSYHCVRHVLFHFIEHENFEVIQACKHTHHVIDPAVLHDGCGGRMATGILQSCQGVVLDIVPVKIPGVLERRWSQKKQSG